MCVCVCFYGCLICDIIIIDNVQLSETKRGTLCCVVGSWCNKTEYGIKINVSCDMVDSKEC